MGHTSRTVTETVPPTATAGPAGREQHGRQGVETAAHEYASGSRGEHAPDSCQPPGPGDTKTYQPGRRTGRHERA
jgi:hypothetical protein